MLLSRINEGGDGKMDLHWVLEHLIYERLLENYCFVLLTNRAPPQISDNLT